jgi:hypothetical protein
LPVDAAGTSLAPCIAVLCRRIALACLVLLGSPACRDSSSKSACLMGDAAGPALVTAAAELGGASCATDATPNATTSSIPTQLDTGGTFIGQPAAYVVGGDYGQPSCVDQFLLEVDLSASNSAGRNVFVSGGWSVLTPASPCGYKATITIWGYDGASWSKFDQLAIQGQSEPISDGGSICHAVVTNRQIHTTLGGTWIPAGTFATARVAVMARACEQKLPVDIIVDE